MTQQLEVKNLWDARAHHWLQILQGSSSVQDLLVQLVSVMPWRIVGVYKVIQGENRVVAQASKGYDRIEVPRIEFPLLPANNIVALCYHSHRTIKLLSSEDWAEVELGEQSHNVIAQLQIEQAVGIPLIHAGRIMGVLYIADGLQSETTLNLESIRVLELLAPTVASMIAKQEVLDAIESENEALHWIQKMSGILLFVNDEIELWRQFKDMLIQLGRVIGGIYVRNEQGEWRTVDVFGVLRPYSGRLKSDVVKWIEHSLSSNWNRDLIKWNPKGVNSLPDYVVEPEGIREGTGLRYYVGADKKLRGVMNLYFHRVEPHVERVLPSLLQMFSMALELIEQRKELMWLGEHDPLTTLYNRRALEERLQQFFHEADRSAIFLLMDLDGFKYLNDTMGHQAGDDSLRKFSGYLVKTLSPEALVARLGGDEFAVMIPDRKFDFAFESELRSLISHSPLRDFNLTASIGVVELPRESRDYPSSYRLADERMYSGKKHGKNTIVGPVTRVV